MSLQDLLTAIHNDNSLKLCKISPDYRENDRQLIATKTQEFLRPGKKITVLSSSNFNTNKKEA